MRRLLHLSAFLTFALAVPPTSAAAASPPKLRLGDAVRPLRYRVELTIVPTAETFEGRVAIDLDFRQASSLVWLNATDLTIREARVQAGGKIQPATIEKGDQEFVGFAFERPVEPGRATLEIAFEGKTSTSGTAGLFRQKEGDDWYVFSQFEATDARRAFPCFDEPSFKVPWQLTLRVPKGNVALTNTPVLAEREAAGVKTVRFRETRPLPSYLVAVAVGPFEVVDAGVAGRKKTPVRIVTPRGKSAEAAPAAESTGPLLALLEDYFGTAYPFEKLDQVAIPMTVGFGAMEHPGLVTYAQTHLLARPGEDSIRWRRRYAGTCAHELAHQWFGNLVTLAWWDDIWLNEAFASWVGEKIIDRWKPDWNVKASGAASRSGAMGADSLMTARRIRQPIESKHDIHNAFDGITYSKGRVVLEMFEAWMGPERFQRGVRRYLEERAWGNATSADFLAALGREGGPGVATAFATFLDQPGVPLVTVAAECDGDAPPRIDFVQQRYLPLGSKGSSEQQWRIPIRIRYRSAGVEGREDALLSDRSTRIPLRQAKGCPDWVLANDGGNGYYRVLYKGGLLSRLLEDGGRQISLPERVAAIGDLSALASSGDVASAEVLALVPSLARDPNRHVVASTIGIVLGLRDHLVPDELRPHYARFVQSAFGPRGRELGWTPKPQEDEDTRLLRPTLVRLVAVEGQDAELRREAAALARRWIEDRKAVDPEVIDAVLDAAVLEGDRALFERLRLEAGKAGNRMERQRLLSGLGGFQDPAIVREALALVLSGDFDARESFPLLFGPLRHPENRPLVLDFVKGNFEALRARLPHEAGAGLVRAGSAFCDDERRADVEAFFKGRVEDLPGGPRALAQTLERIGLCGALKAAQQPSVASFLKGY